MQATTRTKLTYADYAKLPEGAPYQLIDGELVLSPSPTIYHQRISMRLGRALSLFVEAHGLGEVLAAPMDVCLSETNTFQPDLLFVSNARASIVGGPYVEGAPDLVVEILSPSTAYYDLRKKKQVYAASGVGEY